MSTSSVEAELPPSDMCTSKGTEDDVGTKAPAQRQQAQQTSSSNLKEILKPIMSRFYMVVIMVLLTASGHVPARDLGFAIFSSFYIHFMSRYAFPSVSKVLIPGFWDGQKLIRRYVKFAAVVGILFPIVYIIGSWYQGDVIGLRAAIPHLFLLLAQVITEVATFRRVSTSLPVRALVPILYNSRRLFTISTWLSLLNTGNSSNWLLFGKAIAIANMLLWTYNLFGFLLPVFLPRSLRRHYEIEAEQALKTK